RHAVLAGKRREEAFDIISSERLASGSAERGDGEAKSARLITRRIERAAAGGFVFFLPVGGDAEADDAAAVDDGFEIGRRHRPTNGPTFNGRPRPARIFF